MLKEYTSKCSTVSTCNTVGTEFKLDLKSDNFDHFGGRPKCATTSEMVKKNTFNFSNQSHFRKVFGNVKTALNVCYFCWLLIEDPFKCQYRRCLDCFYKWTEARC